MTCVNGPGEVTSPPPQGGLEDYYLPATRSNHHERAGSAPYKIPSTEKVTPRTILLFLSPLAVSPSTFAFLHHAISREVRAF